MSTNLRANIELDANPSRFVSGVQRAEQSLGKLQAGTQKTGQSLQRLDQSTSKSAQSTQRLTQSTTQASQAMQRMGQSTQQAAAGAARMTQSTQQATQATSRFNAGSIGTAASIGTMGAGLVSLEASMSNYTKATFKVEKAELKVQKTTLAAQKARTMLLNAENMLAKARQSGKKTAEELQYYEEQVVNYREDYKIKTDDATLSQEKLNIANMDYADTQKLMASSIATTLLGTLSTAAQLFSAKSIAAGKDTAATKTNMAATIANSRALKLLGIDLSAARVQFQTASASIKGATFSMQGAQMGLKGLAAGFKGLWLSMGPIGILTILATSLYTAWETSQQFRDGVHWLIDEIQKFFGMIQKVITPLQILDRGLQALGINVGENIDQWQEETRVIGEADTAMHDMAQTTAGADAQVQQLTATVDAETAAVVDSTMATQELNAQTMALTGAVNTATAAINQKAAAHSADMAMMRASSATIQSEGLTALQSFRDSIDAASEGARNHERALADNELKIRIWGNEYKRIMAEEGPQAAAVFKMESESLLQQAADNVTKYGGNTQAVLQQHGIDWIAVRDTVQQTSDSVISSTNNMASGVDAGLGTIRTSLTSTQASTIQLMHQMDALSKKKYSVLNELKNIQDVSQMTSAQIARVQAEYNAMKINQNLLAQGLPPQGKFFASEEMGSVYVMGDGETVIREDGTIDYDRLQEIGNISARNLAKIKEQSKAKYGKQAAEYLKTLGFSPVMKGPGGVNISVDDKQDLATARSVTQNMYSTGVQGKGGLYANQGQNIRHHGPGPRSDGANALLRKGVYTVDPVGDGMWRRSHSNSWKAGCGQCKVMDRSIAFWEGNQWRVYSAGSAKHINHWAGNSIDDALYMHRKYGRGMERYLKNGATIEDVEAWLEHPEGAITIGGDRYKQANAPARFQSWFKQWKAYKNILKETGFDGKVYTAPEYKQTTFRRKLNRKTQTTYSTWEHETAKEDMVQTRYERGRRTNRISRVNTYYATREDYERQEESKRLIKEYWERAKNEEARKEREAKEKADKELAAKLAAAEAREKQEREQQIYNSQLQSYNQDMAMYNMIQQMFPGQTPSWKPTMPKSPQQIAFDTAAQNYRNSYVPPPPPPKLTGTPERDEIIRRLKKRRFVSSNPIESYTTEELRAILARTIKLQNGSDQTVRRVFAEIDSIVGTTSQSRTQYANSPEGQAEVQRHTQTLIDAGQWKSEYEGHDVYELRQVIEMNAV